MRYARFSDTKLKLTPGITFALAALMLSLNLGTGLGPDTARAQAANDLRCRGCVNRGDVRKGAVKFKQLQPKLKKQVKDLERGAASRVPFYVTLDGNGAQQTIATNGPLTVFARCFVDNVGNDRVEIVFSSGIAGWFAEVGVSNQNGPFNGSQEVVVMEEEQPTGTTAYDDDNDETSAAAPDGSFIGIAGEASGFGVNIFGHDCIAIGHVFLAKGNP